MTKPEQFAGGALPVTGSNGGICPSQPLSRSSTANKATSSADTPDVAQCGSSSTSESGIRGALSTTNCANLRGRGQKIGERGGSLARRRYQTGRVFLRGKNPVWVGRWRDDVIEDGRIRRPYRSEVLGSKSDFPTKRLALRELEKRLTVVNDPRHRARPTSTFAEFASRWEPIVLSQHKPSTQITLRSHLRKHLVPFFGRMQLRDIGPEEVQCFISSVRASAKTKKNIFATFQMIWKSAHGWSYVAHDATSGVALPKRSRVARRFFSLVEAQRILEAAPEPYRTFYWLAVETGMRAGELCGLRICDIDFHGSALSVCQSAWRGTIQSPKSESAVRCFALSPGLLAHLAEYCRAWRPNEKGLLFATRNGTPWDANLLVKRKLYPLLDSLRIERGGLHAFRHTNSTLMDQLGAPFKVRQQRLGHSDVTLTLNAYTHVVTEDDVRLAAQLDGILHPNAPKKGNGLEVESSKPLFLN
jgi:integrase